MRFFKKRKEMEIPFTETDKKFERALQDLKVAKERVENVTVFLEEFLDEHKRVRSVRGENNV